MVSTAVMGTADVLAGTHGTVVVDEHEDRFAAGVLCVLADAEKRAELSVAATLDAARWSSAAMAGRLIRLYRRVIENLSTSHRNVLIPLDRYSFPAGHTLHAVLFTSLAVAQLPVLGLLLMPFAILVALSRVVLGLHDPTDVLVGAALAAALAALSNHWLAPCLGIV